MKRFPTSLGAAIVALLLVALVFAIGAPAASAAPTCTTDCYVSPTGNDGNDGATSATALATIQLAVNSVNAGGNVHLAAGTYTQDTLLNKSLTLDGGDPLTTFIDAISVGLDISADNVTVKNVAIINSANHGARVFKSGGTVVNTTFDNVHFLANAARGLELTNNTTMNNVRVLNSLFDGNRTGIRMASNAVVDGLDIINTILRNHTDAGSGIGFYQANDGSTGNLRDLYVDDSTFLNNGFAGIYGEEMRDVEVKNSTFTNTARGFFLYDPYTGAPTSTGNFNIHDNIFTDQSATGVLILVGGNNLDDPITIQNNTFTQDVALASANWAQIDIRLQDGFAHAAVNVLGNDVTFNGAFTGAATAVYAIKARGGIDTLEIHDNILDGGNVGDNGGVPATAGLYLVSNTGYYGATDAAAQINVTGNQINGFVNGVVVYDEIAAAAGGLTAGAAFEVHRNDLNANSAYGVSSGAGEVTDAVCNWWGAADGPGPVGPGSGSNVTTGVVFSPWLVTPDLDGPCFAYVFNSTVKMGVVDALAYGPHDVLAWDGNAWSKWFDGSAAMLMPKGRAMHNVNAVWIPLLNGSSTTGSAVMSFTQNGRVVPDIPGKVNGMDLVWYDGSNFSLWFDGEDVGLNNKTKEKIDALHVLDGSESPIGSSCLAYLLISTQGDGKVMGHDGVVIRFDGTDVLGFCMTNSGDATTGLWHRVLNGKAEGMPGQALTSLSVSDDGELLYFTTKAGFHVDSAHGGPSEIFQYSFATGEFSGPYFSFPASMGNVDALHVELLP